MVEEFQPVRWETMERAEKGGEKMIPYMMKYKKEVKQLTETERAKLTRKVFSTDIPDFMNKTPQEILEY